MKPVSPNNVEHADKLDLLSADLATSVYAVALRETNARNWLDLELGIWKAVSMKVDAWGDDLPLQGHSGVAQVAINRQRVEVQ